MASNRLTPTLENPDVVSCVVTVDGKEMPKKYQLIMVTIEQEINKIPGARLQLMDGEANEEDFKISNSGDFVPGKKIEIKLGYHSKTESVFKGIIITNTHRVNDTCAEINVECKDESIKMTISKGSKTFDQITDSDVARQLLDKNHLTDIDVEDSSVKHQQLVQSGVSDWDYMISRIDVVGMICVIQNSHIDIHKPKLNESSVMDLTYGANIIEFHADMDARVQTSAVRTMTWDFTTQKLKTVEGEDPQVEEEGTVTKSKLASVNEQPFEMRTSAPMTEDELQALANARKLRQALSKIKGKVKYQGVTNVAPGNFIKLDGVGDHFNGKAFISAIHHEYSDGDWTTEATLGWSENFFSEETNPHHAASNTGQAATLQGLQSGVVTDIEDKDGEFRVRVKLPVISEEGDGIYARVATLDAGKDRGSFFRPEVDDEVIVGFMNNDARHPVVLGMMHSSSRASVIKPEKKNDIKGYVSRTGIKLTFDDGKTIVRIETPGHRVFELDDNGGKITVKDKDGNKMVMENSGVKIESASKLELKAASSLSISAPQISIKADGTLSAEAGGSTTLKSNGITEVKGSVVKIN